jgi:MOSC domain-containing protein YiiM
MAGFSMIGIVLRTSIKPRIPGQRGLPKPSVPALEVTPRGAVGDFNCYRAEQMPDDLDQALLLLTEEVLHGLQSEGWPVQPGDLGENLTLAGVPERMLAPGVRLRIADVLLEVSLACDPCTTLYALPYVGRERGPEFLRRLHGRRGWYARVLQPGLVTPGSPVVLLGRASAAPTQAPA